MTYSSSHSGGQYSSGIAPIIATQLITASKVKLKVRMLLWQYVESSENFNAARAEYDNLQETGVNSDTCLEARKLGEV